MEQSGSVAQERRRSAMSARSNGTIVAAGHICLDLIPEIPAGRASMAELFRPGKLVDVGRATTATGGSVANTGIALHRLGVPVRLVGKTGDDSFGDAIRRIVAGQGAGLADHMVTAAGAGSSYTIVISPPGIDRVFLHHSGPNDTFCAADVGTAHLEGASVLHFGYPPLMARMRERSGAELAALFARARAAGVSTSLDMAHPDPDGPSGRVDWAAYLRNVLPHVDFFLPSLDEIAFMLRGERARRPTPESAAPARGLAAWDPKTDRTGDPADHFVEMLVEECLRLGASEATIAPAGEGSALRAVVRGGGVQALPAPPPGWHRKIVARLKTHAKLDLLNRRDVQQGQATFVVAEQKQTVTVRTRPMDGAEAADILLPGAAEHVDEETAELAQSLRDISSWLIEAGAAVVMLKLGDQGVYLRTTHDAPRLQAVRAIARDKLPLWLGRELVAPCYLANAVGTTGSGDCTIAGFLASVHAGAGPMEAISFATAVGACSVEAADATSGVPARDVVMQRILSGWAKRPLRAELPGWHWLDQHKVWIGPNDIHL